MSLHNQNWALLTKHLTQQIPKKGYNVGNHIVQGRCFNSVKRFLVRVVGLRSRSWSSTAVHAGTRFSKHSLLSSNGFFLRHTPSSFLCPSSAYLRGFLCTQVKKLDEMQSTRSSMISLLSQEVQ